MVDDLELRFPVTGDGVALALYETGTGPTVLFVHGTFSNRTLWLGTRGHGLARLLAERFHVAVIETRGHGRSDLAPKDRRWTIDDVIGQDLPTAIAALPAGPFLAIGHSAGGALILGALIDHPELAARCRGIVLIGTPFPTARGLRRLAAAVGRLLANRLSTFPARALGFGPEDEPGGIFASWMDCQLRGAWTNASGARRVDRLGSIGCPVLALTGAADRLWAPRRECAELVRALGANARLEVIGRASGAARDYRHADLVASRAAAIDVWPKVATWLNARA